MNWIEQKSLGFFVKTKGVFSSYLLGGIGHVFMLHRVLPEELREKYTINRSLAITPDFLEDIIKFLIKKDFQFVSLDELYRSIQNREKPKKRLICFTLDDGYRDNMEHGAPVFKKYNIPYTIYVTNCFPNKTAQLWWYWLEEKVRNENGVIFNEVRYDCSNEQLESKTFAALRGEIKNTNLNERNQLAQDFFHKTQDQIAAEVNEIALSWEELKQITSEPLLTIGSHTINHLSLTSLSDEEVKSEIREGKKELENQLGFDINHFAYPYGGLEDAGAREFRIANELGFKTATLNYPGNVFFEHKKAMMAIPRYPLSNDTSEESINQFLNGIRHFNANQFDKIIRY